jgi:hypothetical protein
LFAAETSFPIKLKKLPLATFLPLETIAPLSSIIFSDGFSKLLTLKDTPSESTKNSLPSTNQEATGFRKSR